MQLCPSHSRPSVVFYQLVYTLVLLKLSLWNGLFIFTMHPVNFALLSSLAGLSLAAPPSSSRLSSRQSDKSGWNPPADLAKPLKEVWDHCEKTYNGGDLYSFKNYGWDQIMATKG